MLFTFTHACEFELLFNFLRDLLVLLFNHVDVRVKHVHVVVQRVVLLFSFNECGNDFFDAANASGLFNLFEGVFNNLHVSGVHFHQNALFFVISNLTVKSLSQQRSWVGDFTLTCSVGFLVDSFGAGLVEFPIVTLLQFFLKLENLGFEALLVVFVLLLKRKNLVDLTFGEGLCV